MKYHELDKPEWKWLSEAIIKHDWVTIGKGRIDYIQAAGLYISPKNRRLYVVSIQGDEYAYPKNLPDSIVRSGGRRIIQESLRKINKLNTT